MCFLKDFFYRAGARIYAIYNAKVCNEKKMKKVYSVDNYWLRVWKKPSISLTDEQLSQVHAFWDKYSFAYKNDPRIQEHFTLLSGRFDPRYCGPGLNAYYMFRFYDNPDYHTAFHNKNYREFLFKDFSCTPAVVHRIRGMYYDESFNPISYDEAMMLLQKEIAEKESKLIVKPTPGGGGNGITFIRRGDEKTSISDRLDSIKGDDVIIERIVKAHPSYAVANPTSLNSLRIITLLYENKCTVVAILFRMGALAKEVDNFAQGGVACGVTSDGVCMDCGFDHHGNLYTKHPNGFDFAGHQLYGVDKAVELAKKLHWRIPQFRQMSWDIAVDETGRPTLIEMNPRGDANIYQSIGALPFGDNTAQILDEYLFLYFYKLGATWKWDYKEYSDHIVLTGYGWNEKRIKVPEKINGKYVTQITEGCFTSDKIREIIINGCIKSVDANICSKDVKAKIIQLEDSRGFEISSPGSIRGEAFEGRNVLSWDPVDGATQYYIYRMRQGDSRKFLRAVSAKAESFSDYNVLEGVVYYYYIRSRNSKYGIMSGWSETIKIRSILR